MFSETQTLFAVKGPWRVPIHIGPSIVLMVVIFVSFTEGPRMMAYDMGFLALLLLSILLHELGHAWGAIIQGIRVERIMLHGMGGYCQPARSGTPYEEELIVAMGPIVTLVLWAVSRLVANGLWAAGYEYDTLLWAIETLAWINGFLAILNLLPIFPLDGGHLAHLALLRLTSPARAERLALYISLGALGCLFPYLVWNGNYYSFAMFFLPVLTTNWQRLRARA